MDHPSEKALKRFASGTASREESRAIVSHLVKGCADCARKLRSLIEPEPPAGPAYDDVLARFDRGFLTVLEAPVNPAALLLRI